MSEDVASTAVALDHELRGSGPSVVLMHGITEDRRTWEPLVGDLATTHQVLAVDLRGHGGSPSTAPYDLEAMANDVNVLVERLGMAEPLVVGHSLGGMVATAYAAASSARGVVNVDQSLDLVSFQDQLREVEPVLRGEGFAAVAEQLFTSMQGPLSPAQASWIGGIRTPKQEVLLGVWAPVFDLTADELGGMVDNFARSVTVPYLAIHGIDPGPGYAEWLTERIPTAEVEVWDSHGHYPHLIDPSRFLERLREFDPAA